MGTERKGRNKILKDKMSEPKREVANYEPFYNTAPTAPLVDPPLCSAVVIDDNVEKVLPGLCACSKPGYLKWFGLTCCCPMISMYAMSQWFGQARRGYLLLFVLMAILDIIVMPWLYEVRAAQATQGGVIDWMVETEFGIWDNDAVSSSLHYTIITLELVELILLIVLVIIAYKQRRQLLMKIRATELPIFTCLQSFFCMPCSYGQMGAVTEA